MVILTRPDFGRGYDFAAKLPHHDVPAMTMRDNVAAPPFFPKLSQIIRQRPGRVGSYNPTVLARPLEYRKLLRAVRPATSR